MLRQKPYAEQPEFTTDIQKRSHENTTVELGASTFAQTLSNFDKKKFIIIIFFFLHKRGRKFESL